MNTDATNVPDHMSHSWHALFSPLREPAQPPEQDPLSVEILLRGTQIGRFVILDRLGSGAMGVVYSAYDPDLDRKIALKLITRGGDEPGSALRTRLLREAQALARLAHPNVVTIHEVHSQDSQAWIAMEYVAGWTLSAWARNECNSWPELLRVLTDVARGVAAAHAAGVVHRDLKPQNVMIDMEGRVRVMDFGLAHGRTISTPSTQVETENSARPESDTSQNVLSARLTQTGATPGTPAYMAPEQWRGQDAGNASDQFAWSVLAWELLYGERPFAGETIEELANNVICGRRRTPPHGRRNSDRAAPDSRRIPGWLRRTVERGLAVDPTQRWPSMAVLVAMLERGQTRARIKTAVLVLTAVAVLGAGVVGYQTWQEARLTAQCTMEGRIEDSWNRDTRLALQNGILATGAAHATMAASRVASYVDAQAEAWTKTRTRVCLNARVHKVWSEDMLDRAVWCLDERRMELEALIAEFSSPSTSTVQIAVEAAASLSRLEPCQDYHRLKMLPELPQQREGVRRVLRTLSRVGALRLAGKYTEGLEEVDSALVRADELDWPPLMAAALSRRGDILERSGSYPEAEAAFKTAYFQAATVGAFEIAADAAGGISWTVGQQQARHEEGFLWSRHEEVMLSILGMGHDNFRRGWLLSNRASIHESAAEYEDAKELYQQACPLFEQSLGFEHPAVATCFHNLAFVHFSVGEYREAIALYERSLAINEITLGLHHPDASANLNNLAQVHMTAGEYSTAVSLYERALAINEEALGSDHPDIGKVLGNLALVHMATGNYSEAQPLFERALVIAENALSPDHTQIATAVNNLGMLHDAIGEYVQAEAYFERALTSAENALGSTHPQTATYLNNLAGARYSMGAFGSAKELYERALSISVGVLGSDHSNTAMFRHNLANVYFATGEYRAARSHYERARDVWQATLGPEHPQVAYPMVGLAKIALEQHLHAEALALAEHALQIRERGNVPPEKLAESCFVLARALWETPISQGGDRNRALALARRAREGFRGVKGKEKDLADVESFLSR